MTVVLNKLPPKERWAAQVMGACSVPSIFLHHQLTLHNRRKYYCPHFSEEETEAGVDDLASNTQLASSEDGI